MSECTCHKNYTLDTLIPKYAGLLGKDPRHFTIRSCPAGSNDEKTIYSYEFDKKGNPSRMICQTTYAGGQANYYPYTRNISVSFE